MPKAKLYYLAFILAIIIGGVYLVYYMSSQAKQEVEDYLTTIQSGRTFDYNLQVPQERFHHGLLQLKKDGLWQIQGKLKVAVTGAFTRRVSAKIDVLGNAETLEFDLRRSNGQWEIMGGSQLIVLPAAYLYENTGQEVKLIFAGKEYNFKQPLEQQEHDVIYLVAVNDSITYSQSLLCGPVQRILLLSQDSVEGERSGQLDMWDNVQFYQELEAGAVTLSNSEILLGTSNMQFYEWNGEVRSIVKRSLEFPAYIRVLLHKSGFTSIKHSKINLSAHTGVIIEDKLAEETYNIPSNQVVRFTNNENNVVATWGNQVVSFANRIMVYPRAEARVSISSISRAQGNPTYRGKMEVYPWQGELLLINEVLLEEYLFSVVPSEMPVSFGQEALKVQSVAARTYAVNEIYAGAYKHLGGHVVDSVMSQVYNNRSETETANRAVEATEGLMLTSEGEIIDAKFFSTSCGFTANFNEVWGLFATPKVDYLQAQPQFTNDITFDLPGSFRMFLASELDAFDSPSPWYRWSVDLPINQLTESLNAEVKRLLKEQSSFAVERESVGDKQLPVGEIIDITMLQRGQGGNLMWVEISGTNGTYEIGKELNIRKLLKPVGTADIWIERHDGTKVRNYALLPSAFCYFTPRHDETGLLKTLTISGGGNGHGVGMSQWGVKGMVERGYSFREILLHFYPRTRLSNID